MKETSFRNRRRIGLAATVLAVSIVGAVAWLAKTSGEGGVVFSGMTLMAAIAILSARGLRRRFAFLPLGSESVWSQVHLYVGLFAIGVYLIHAPTFAVEGRLEGLLAACFLLLSGSGIYGSVFDRAVPRRWSAVEPTRCDPPPTRRQIGRLATSVGEGLGESGATAELAEYYRRELAPFFACGPSWSRLLMSDGSRAEKLIGGLAAIAAGMEDGGREVAARWSALVRSRDDLDCRMALRARRRLWIALHVIFSVTLVVGAILHGLQATTHSP